MERGLQASKRTGLGEGQTPCSATWRWLLAIQTQRRSCGQVARLGVKSFLAGGIAWAKAQGLETQVRSSGRSVPRAWSSSLPDPSPHRHHHCQPTTLPESLLPAALIPKTPPPQACRMGGSALAPPQPPPAGNNPQKGVIKCQLGRPAQGSSLIFH
jgi:hypothetical protein